MAIRAIRVIVNTEAGTEHTLGLSFDDPPIAEEKLPFMIAYLFRSVLATLDLDHLRVDITEREKLLPFEGLGKLR